MGLLLAALLALGQQSDPLKGQTDLLPPPPRMPADESPTPFACTLEIALRGQDCTYEGTPGPGDARENARLASEAGAKSCAAEEEDDHSIQQACVHEAQRIAALPRCTMQGRRLVDREGRLVPGAAACIAALRETVSRAARRAALGSSCCDCLSRNGCVVPGAQCREELGDLAPGPDLQACLARDCNAACSFSVAPPAPVPADDPPPPPSPPQRRRAQKTRSKTPEKI